MKHLVACYANSTVTVYCLHCSSIRVESGRAIKRVQRVVLPATEQFLQNIYNLSYFIKKKKDNTDLIDLSVWIAKHGDDKPRDGYQKITPDFATSPRVVKSEIIFKLITELQQNIGPFMDCIDLLCTK